MSKHPRYEIVLEATSMPGDLEGVRALRALLKRLLRAFGFRCLACRRLDPSDRKTEDSALRPEYTTPC